MLPFLFPICFLFVANSPEDLVFLYTPCCKGQGVEWEFAHLQELAILTERNAVFKGCLPSSTCSLQSSRECESLYVCTQGYAQCTLPVQSPYSLCVCHTVFVTYSDLCFAASLHLPPHRPCFLLFQS
jgi:hypothetical protein